MGRPTPRPHALFQDGLLRWATAELRDLPWRQTRDPWAILVAETMLQQTQVARVAPRWQAFLDRWPTPSVCADAPVADIVIAWSGLGYNRRAIALHATATAIHVRHDGQVPAELDQLLALPGVGPYTARAVRAFAFELDGGVVDVNAARVLARAVAGRQLRPAEAQQLADELAVEGSGWLWNQAMLELGALRCTKRRPSCDDCPVAEACAWRGVGADPAEGSAGTTSRQSRFEGSDRQGRGRLVAALRIGPVALGDVDAITGWGNPSRSSLVATSLITDGLAVQQGDGLTLPHAPRR